LIRYRVKVEIEYFIELCKLPLPQLAGIDPAVFDRLRETGNAFSMEDAARIKEIEKTTNHDVKAVEYFVKEVFDEMGLSSYKEFIHFGLTSQDINNTAMPLALKEAWQAVLLPVLDQTVAELNRKAQTWKAVPMLARTHGQPASPTRLGKEIFVFVERLNRTDQAFGVGSLLRQIRRSHGEFQCPPRGLSRYRLGCFRQPIGQRSLGLKRSQTTTQIEHYDHFAAFFDGVKRVNTILLDFCRDLWTYISMDYFKQEIKAGEIGSSAMPHKVNPIDFENAEGNLGIANAVFEHLSAKLPISRLQRDLTDSTVTRNIGVPMGHTLIALKSIQRGLGKLILNDEALHKDLEANWAVVAEGIQTVLRREGYPKPYEALLALTRTHAAIDKAAIGDFIESLDVSDSVKKELLDITPESYTGI
jgi:adenylosuccinate lyase